MATFGRRRGRPPHPEILTPSEQRVLELIREGRTNSEIAYELAISVAGVKYHVTNMLGKLGVADRAGLAAWRGDGTQRERRQQQRAGIPLVGPLLTNLKAAAAVGLGGAGALAVVVMAVSGQSGSARDIPPATVTFETPAGYSTMAPGELEALGMVDAGPILRSKSGEAPVFAGHIRDTLSVALLTGPADVVEGLGEPWTFYLNASVPNWISLVGSVGGMAVRVQLWAENRALDEDTHLTIAEDGTRVVVSQRAGAPAELLVSVEEVETRRPLTAAIATNGHLFVGEPNVPDSLWVVDAWTGELLDVSAAFRGERLGEVAQGLFRFTGCDTEADRVCYVSARTHLPLLAPFAGTLRCLSPSHLEIDHGDFVVRITQVDTGYGSSPEFSCQEHSVRAGDSIGPAGRHWVFNAVDASGTPLSVGVALDGSLYFGDFRPSVECPCRSGS